MNETNERSVASAGSTANDGQVSRRAILGTNHMRPIVERSGVPFVLVPYGMTLEAVVDPRERGE